MTTTDTLPAPLTPADCDLRDFPFMKLDVKRLRDSDMALTESPEACWAAVLLWSASWHQVPAASLPDDDRVLSNLAGYGRVVKEWLKHKAGALHGWVKCSDGRLYHKTVAENACEAWESKLQQRWKTECARIKKHNERHKTAHPIPLYEEWLAAGRPQDYLPLGDSKACPEPVPSDNASKGEGEGEGEGKREGERESINTNTHTQPASVTEQPARDAQTAQSPDGGVGATPSGANPPTPTRTSATFPPLDDDTVLEDNSLPEYPTSSTKAQLASAVCLALKSEGMVSTNPAHPELRALLDNGATVDSFVQAFREMRERGNSPAKPFAYVIGVVRGQMQRAADLATAAVAGAGNRPVAGQPGVAPTRPLNRQEALEASNREVARRFVARQMAAMTADSSQAPA